MELDSLPALPILKIVFRNSVSFDIKTYIWEFFLFRAVRFERFPKIVGNSRGIHSLPYIGPTPSRLVHNGNDSRQRTCKPFEECGLGRTSHRKQYICTPVWQWSVFTLAVRVCRDHLSSLRGDRKQESDWCLRHDFYATCMTSHQENLRINASNYSACVVVLFPDSVQISNYSACVVVASVTLVVDADVECNREVAA